MIRKIILTICAVVFIPILAIIADPGNPISFSTVVVQGLRSMMNDEGKIHTLTFSDDTTQITAAGGSGDVTKVDTPVNNQIGIWTGDGTLEGVPDLTFDGASLIIGASDSTTRLLLPQSNDAVTPTLAFGDGDTGFFEISDDVLRIALGEAANWEISAAYLGSSITGRARISRSNPSATVPVFLPGGSVDSDTGLGYFGPDALSLIAGGVEGLRITESGGNITNALIGTSTFGNQQASLNNITDVSGATNEYVLTKDTGSGDATWKVAPGAGGGISSVLEDITPQLGGDLDLNGKNLDFPTTPDISDVLDEDNMASDSATMLATQQSIKAYDDSGTQDLTNKTINSSTNNVHADSIHELLRNESGGTINRGDAVYVSGYNVGLDIALVTLADADSVATMPSVALVEDSSITNNSTGEFVEVGTLSGFDTSAWSVGDQLYISGTGTTGNTLTNTKPTGTALIQKVAAVLRSHASLGVVEVFGAGRANALPNLADTKVWIGDTNGVPQEFALSGDATMDAGGVVIVADDQHAHTAATISGLTEDDMTDGSDIVRSGIVFIIDGGGSAITTGIKGDVEIPFNCTLIRATLLADQSTTTTVDFWLDSYANFPPTNADSMTDAGTSLNISAGIKAQDATMTSWTIAITAGDIIRFNVDANNNAEKLTISLVVEK